MDLVHCHLNRKLPSPLGAIITRQYAGSYVKFRQKQIREVLSRKCVWYKRFFVSRSLIIQVYEILGILVYCVTYTNADDISSPPVDWGTTIIR
jgi:hypothetical protein